MKVTNKIIPKS